MNPIHSLFYFFILLAAISAVAIVFSRNVFKSTLLLLVCLLSIAALYVLCFAEFLAVTQVLIYAGGILVVIIFGIMLTTKISGGALIVGNGNIFSGAVVGIGLFAVLLRYLPFIHYTEGPGLGPDNISVIGFKIFSVFSLPFEVAGLLLLVALVGAAVITSHLKSKA